MQTASEYDIAFSMMRLWGHRATALAGQYAFAFERQGRGSDAAKWNRVQGVVSDHLRFFTLSTERHTEPARMRPV